MAQRQKALGGPQLERPHPQDGEDQKLLHGAHEDRRPLRAERHARDLAPELAQLGAEAGLLLVGLPQPRLMVAGSDSVNRQAMPRVWSKTTRPASAPPWRTPRDWRSNAE